MTCREMAAFLDEYVAGQLAGAVHTEFEVHITNCDDCLSYLAQYRTTIRAAGAVATAPIDPLPDALVAAILAALEKDDRRP